MTILSDIISVVTPPVESDFGIENSGVDTICLIVGEFLRV